jgi:hypothetical protein
MSVTIIGIFRAWDRIRRRIKRRAVERRAAKLDRVSREVEI